MDGQSIDFVRRYNALNAELMYVDAQLTASVGALRAQLAARKTQILSEMVQICVAQGCTELAYHCECARSSHTARFPIRVDQAAGIASDSCSLSVAPCASRENKARVECSSKYRLANVAPKTPDQVNDKKVAEKSSQVDRAFVQLETMTTPVDENSSNFPRHNSFILSVSECNPNCSGGNRTKSDFVEEKRRNGRVVVIRSTDNSMLADGTLESALLAAAQKVKTWNEQRLRGSNHMMCQQDRLSVKGSPYDVAVALDFETYYKHLFTDELSFLRHHEKTVTSHGWELQRQLGAETRICPSRSSLSADIQLPNITSLVSNVRPIAGGAVYARVLPGGMSLDGAGVLSDLRAEETMTQDRSAAQM